MEYGLLLGMYTDYSSRMRLTWHPDSRPADHPMDCDCRKSLGLDIGLQYSARDIEKRRKKASVWWHPDKRTDKKPGDHQAFLDFCQIVSCFKKEGMLEKYASQVKQEMELIAEFNRDMDWRMFNERFFRSIDSKDDEHGQPAPRDEAQPEEPEICHVFLDGSVSMLQPSNRGELSRLQAGKDIFSKLFPRFVESPTSIHLIGEGPQEPQSWWAKLVGRPVASDPPSRCLIHHKRDISLVEEDDLLGSWTATAKHTYLWKYIYDQVKDFKDAKHDVIIITDGLDNKSEAPFLGLSGFDGLMSHMQGGPIRISLYLLGNEVSKQHAFTYRDLCMATGGFFGSETHGQDSDSLHQFVLALIMPEGERDALAVQQQSKYQDMLRNGEAQPFDWLPTLMDCATTAHDSADSDPTPSSGSSSTAPSSDHILPFTKVVIHGLQSAVELNGSVAICEKWLAAQGRWQVQIAETGDVKALLPSNLLVCAA